MDKITNQKNVARKVLNLLEITDPNCILAGGAPREWWFGELANDLDFYVYWGDNTTSIRLQTAYVPLPILY